MTRPAIAAPLQLPPRLGQRSGCANRVAVPLQERAQDRSNVGVVFDNKDGEGGGFVDRVGHRHFGVARGRQDKAHAECCDGMLGTAWTARSDGVDRCRYECH